MFVNVSSLIVLLLLTSVSFAQAPKQEVKTQEELVSTLIEQHQNPKAVDELLKTHPELVNHDLWTRLVNRADISYYSERPERSLIIYNLASKVAGELKHSRLLALTYYYLGRAHSGLNQFLGAVGAYEKSRIYFEEAGLRRDLIYILADLGALYILIEDYARAKTYSEESLALVEAMKREKASDGTWPPEYGQTRALATLADISLREGDYTQAIARLQKSLSIHKEPKSCCYPTDIPGDLQALGRVYTASGDYKQALLHLNQALQIVTGSSDPIRVASLLNSVGILYLEQEDYAQARVQFEQSLKIYRSEKDIREEGRVLLNLGVVEQRQSNHDEALRYFRESMESAKAIRFAEIEIVAGEGIGVVLTAKKKYEEALRVLNESLILARRLNDKTRQSELLWRIAQTHYALGEFVQSTQLSQDALKVAHVAHAPKILYLAATTLGQSYAAQNQMDLATQTLKNAVEQIESHRSLVVGREVGTQMFFENRVDTYHALIDLLVKQGRLSDALSYAERAKGRVLLDVLREGKANLDSTLTPAENEQVRHLNRNILELNERLRTEESKTGSDPTLLSQLYAKRDRAHLEYESFQNALFAAHPHLSVRRGRTTPLSLEEISGLTRNKETAYIEYVVTKERVYLFALKGSGSTEAPELKVYPLAINPEDLSLKVNQFHQRLANRHSDFAGIAQELYATLIGPAREQLRGITTICIVPDGFLWNLPFQALISESNRHLIEDRALYYAPSLTVLREMNKATVGKRERKTSLLAFGNPVIGKDEQSEEEICPLPEAEKEVTSIAKTFSSSRNKVFIGREASEETFRALAPTYATIHLATHGVLDNRQPLYSHLMLTKTEGDPKNDGLLEAREIMNMNLRADLAVLSACETANGRIAPGEGVMGMSWAFFVAGTRTMVVSQWKVNSASTSQLMANFYQALESRQSHINANKAKALQDAALKTMSDQRYRHPFYWAGFVMIGKGT